MKKLPLSPCIVHANGDGAEQVGQLPIIFLLLTMQIVRLPIYHRHLINQSLVSLHRRRCPSLLDIFGIMGKDSRSMTFDVTPSAAATIQSHHPRVVAAADGKKMAGQSLNQVQFGIIFMGNSDPKPNYSILIMLRRQHPHCMHGRHVV